MEDFQDAPKFKDWIKTLKTNGCKIDALEEKGLIHRINGELLFAFLTCNVEGEKKKLPSSVLIRGHAVVIIPIIKIKETGEEKLALIYQKRIATGGIHLELPAGMLDQDVSDPKKVAVKEIKEEIGLEVTKEELIAINDKPFYTSPGLLDEGIYYYYFKRTLSEEECLELEGKMKGNLDEHEEIQVVFKPFDQAFQEIRSSSNLLGLYLYKDIFTDKS